jgi:GNAT superfamily N-acetyltransferase
MRLIVADPPLRDRIQDETWAIWHEGLTRVAFGRWNEAQMRTAWGRDRLHRLALVDDEGGWLTSMKRYRFEARLDGGPVAMLGVGAVFTPAAARGRGFARRIVEHAIEEEQGRGGGLAALFSEIGREYYERAGFVPVPLEEVTLSVSLRAGAPAMLVRSGTDADLAAVAAMHERRSAGARLALVRSPELIQFAIAKKRLLAGLGPPGAREVGFFVAEEGHTAVAYVVISIDARGWFIEEAGDRDPAAARLGAMLQVLLAREPSHPPPAIRAWWPSSFPVPPQVTIEHRSEPADIFMVRPLAGSLSPLAPSDVFYWHADYF